LGNLSSGENIEIAIPGITTPRMVRTAWPLLLALLLVITSPPFTHSLSFLSMKQRDVLVVGLNPALQRSVTLPSLVVGAVNRGASVQIGIGGKGPDVVVAAASMAAVPQPVLLQLLGKGAEGDTLLGLIKAVQPHTFVNSLSVRTQARCRTAITLVDASRQEATEIVEPSGTTSAEEVAMLLLAVERQYFQDKAGGVALMGSMPPGCPPTLYADVLQRVVDARSKVLLDTATGVDEALRVCRDVGCAALLKVNARELCALAGMPAATAGQPRPRTPPRRRPCWPRALPWRTSSGWRPLAHPPGLPRWPWP